MKYSERLRPLMEARERIKRDKTIPKGLKKKLLVVNGFLQRKASAFFEAEGILKGSKGLLKKVRDGKMGMDEYKRKIGRAVQQIAEIKSFVRSLRSLVQV